MCSLKNLAVPSREKRGTPDQGEKSLASSYKRPTTPPASFWPSCSRVGTSPLAFKISAMTALAISLDASWTSASLAVSPVRIWYSSLVYTRMNVENGPTPSLILAAPRNHIQADASTPALGLSGVPAAV